MSRVAVVGAGAIGCVFGGHLASAGRHEIVFCVREPFEEIIVETSSGELRSPARCAVEPGGLEPADWVLLATKVHQTPGTASWLNALCGAGTRVAVLQNGVDHAERVAPLAGAARVMPVVVNCLASRKAPGRVSHRSRPQIIAGDDDAGRDLAALFEGRDIDFQIVPDMVTAVWRKLCTNVANSAITALTNEPFGVFRHPGLEELAEAFVRECIEVGRAEGARLGDGVAAEIRERLGAAPPDTMPSMLVDRRAGRPLEADAQYGVIVRLGERHGIETPLCRAAAALLGAVNMEP
jgi:2-dehydropantoate 2-reductase